MCYLCGSFELSGQTSTFSTYRVRLNNRTRSLYNRGRCSDAPLLKQWWCQVIELDSDCFGISVNGRFASGTAYRAPLHLVAWLSGIILVFWAAEVEFTISSTNNDSYTISPNEVRVMRTRKTLGSILRATNFASSFHYWDRIDLRSPKWSLIKAEVKFTISNTNNDPYTILPTQVRVCSNSQTTRRCEPPTLRARSLTELELIPKRGARYDSARLMVEPQKGMRHATEVDQNKQSPTTESLFGSSPYSTTTTDGSCNKSRRGWSYFFC